MSTTVNMTELKVLLAAALTEAQGAKAHRAEDNPLLGLTLKDLRHGRGVRMSADQYPALNMPAKIGAEEGIAVDIETERRAGLEEGRTDKSASRMAAARSRAARKAQIDALADSPVVPDRDRLQAAWLIVGPMSEIVTKIAQSKQAWASRFLGSAVDDIAQIALEKMVLVLAKDDKDLPVLTVAAQELGGVIARTGRVPAEQEEPGAKRERKQIAKARKWLMGMANNRVMGALVDAYTSRNNLRWENIDVIATVMASINGAGEDPTTTHFKASKAPAMLGSRYQRPGSFDPNWLATAISAAITEKGLDRLTELMLDDERRRTDGAFMWSENAEAVFLATEQGAWRWSLVCTATAMMADPRRARAKAAWVHVQNLFTWLPSFIVAVINTFDQEAVERVWYADGHEVAVMRSYFDTLLDAPLDAPRTGLRPALNFATAEDAAHALTRYLSVLVTGEDFAASIAHA